jgi:hypothetical protein
MTRASARSPSRRTTLARRLAKQVKRPLATAPPRLPHTVSNGSPALAQQLFALGPYLEKGELRRPNDRTLYGKQLFVFHNGDCNFKTA